MIKYKVQFEIGVDNDFKPTSSQSTQKGIKECPPSVLEIMSNMIIEELGKRSCRCHSECKKDK